MRSDTSVLCKIVRFDTPILCKIVRFDASVLCKIVRFGCSKFILGSRARHCIQKVFGGKVGYVVGYVIFY